MTLSLPEGPLGRALAVASGVVVIATVWLAAAQPLLDIHATRSEALQGRLMLADHMSDVAASLPELQRQAAGQTPDLLPASAMLEGATDALAGATLQGMMESMATQLGGHLSSTEIPPASQVGPYRRVSLHVTLDASWPLLMRLLQSIERSTPRLFISELRIVAQPSVDKRHEPTFTVTVSVLAFRAAQADASTVTAGRSAGWSAR